MGKNYVLESTVFQAAGHAEGDGWIYYEAAITPYEYFGGLTGRAEYHLDPVCQRCDRSGRLCGGT